MSFLSKFSWINWDNIKKVLIAVLVLCLIGFIIKMQWDAKTKQDALNQQMIEMKQLQDGIARSQSKYVSKDDLDSFAKKIDIDLSVIKKDLDQYGAEVKAVSTFVAQSAGRQSSNIPSGWVTPRPKDPDNPMPTGCDASGCVPDEYGYWTSSQHLGLTEPFSNGEDVPFGTVTFEAWKKNPWSVDQPPREYHVATVLGQDENGRHYVHNKFQIGVNGKRYTIPIDQAEVEEVYPEATFRFDPHLNLGVDVGVSIATSVDPTNLSDPRFSAEVIPNLEVSLFSYGETRKNPDWTFLGLGLGYGAERNSLDFVVNPVNYNIGKPIPLMDNFYIGPQVGVDIKGNVFVGGGVRVGL